MSALPTFDHIEEELSAMLSIPDEELTEEQKLDLEHYLDELAGQEADKIDRFCQFVRIESERADAIKAESKRLARKAQTAQNRLDYIRARYLTIMQQHGVRKVSGKVYTASVRESQAVAIEDQAVIPAEFWKVKEERTVDKVMVKNHIKAGQVVPGCSLIPTYSLLTR